MQKIIAERHQRQSVLLTAGEINMDAAREVHPFKSIGCFIKKPINTDALVRRIRAELE